MAADPFDASTYLAGLDPGIAYTISRPSGGVVNLTVRATKTVSADLDRGRFPKHASLILKHALPYVAGVGPAAPLTLHRQTIEARALSLFDPSKAESLAGLTNENVMVPFLLYHDAEQYVLVLSDLGILPNLSDIFSSLGGFSPGEEPSTSALSSISSLTKSTSAPAPAPAPAPTSPTKSYYSAFASLGTNIGTFLSHLHSHSTLSHITTAHPSPTYFLNSELRSGILSHAIKPVITQLKLFPLLLTAPEADTLGSALIDDFVRPLVDEEKSFVIGDCWTGTILVDRSTLYSDPISARIGVIDWEFASIGRGPHGDMAQFLAHLELLRVAAEYSGNEAETVCLKALVEALVKSYVRFRQLQGTTERNLEAVMARSACLSHGAEIVNNAFWKRWICEREDCGLLNAEHVTERIHECSLIQTMVKRGVQYLRMAGRNSEEFDRNLAERVQTEGSSKDRLVLLDLFDVNDTTKTA